MDWLDLSYSCHDDPLPPSPVRWTLSRIVRQDIEAPSSWIGDNRPHVSACPVWEKKLNCVVVILAFWSRTRKSVRSIQLKHTACSKRVTGTVQCNRHGLIEHEAWYTCTFPQPNSHIYILLIFDFIACSEHNTPSIINQGFKSNLKYAIFSTWRKIHSHV